MAPPAGFRLVAADAGGVVYLMWISRHHIVAIWILPIMAMMIADNVYTA